MSSDAIHSVTEFLRKLLEWQFKESHDTLTPTVTTLPPGKELADKTGANLYLYRVQESPFTKNQSWRGDRVTPPSPRPALGLQLFYMVTPLAPDDEVRGAVSHLLLGDVMRVLYENPVLNDVHLPDLDADKLLAASIRNSFEAVKVSLLPASVDEVSKIWATMNEPYRLSVAYEVSLVELTPSVPRPPGGGIVLSTGVYVETRDPPRPTGLEPETGPLVRVGAGDELVPQDLTVRGSGLLSPRDPASPLAVVRPTVRVGGRAAAVKDVPAPTAESVKVTLPPEPDAGPQADVSVSLKGVVGVPIPFTVSPWLAESRPVRTALDAAVAADKTLALAVSGLVALPREVRFEGPEGPVKQSTFDPASTPKNVLVPVPDALPNGLYAVRVVAADGAATNARRLEVIPRLDAVTPVLDGQFHKLVVTGRRLKSSAEPTKGVSGTRLVLDGVSYPLKFGTPQDDRIEYTLSRRLTPGPHRLAVGVDGRLSRTKEFEVSRV